MAQNDSVTEVFEANRPHLRSVAYRMLGSSSAADDAVQETWLRLRRSDTSEVENLSAWLTTVVARVCLDALRSRTSRREVSFDDERAEPFSSSQRGPDFGPEIFLAESLGPALLVVLDTLTPAERVAFVMHDVFAAPFDEIAAIVGRSPAATRQLASRARRRVHGAPVILDDDAQRQRRVVEAFLRASRRGDFAALLALLDPGIVMTSDSTALDMGSPERLDGADDVATQFSGQARAARLTLLNGAVGLLWRVGDRPKVAFEFVTVQDRVAAINLRADHDFLDQLEWEPLDG